MNVIKWLDNRFEEVAMMLLLLVISAVMAYSVVMRYIFNNSLSWAEEICKYCFVWSTFLSASLCLKRRSSIKIDMLLLALPQTFQRIVLIVGDLIMLGFFSYFLNAAWKVTVGMYNSGQTSPAMELPMYLVFASTVVGFALCIVRLAQRLLFLVKTSAACYNDHIEAGKGGN